MIRILRSKTIKEKQIIKDVHIEDTELICDCCSATILPNDIYLHVSDYRTSLDALPDYPEEYHFCNKHCFISCMQHSNDFDSNGRLGEINLEYRWNNLAKKEYTQYLESKFL